MEGQGEDTNQHKHLDINQHNTTTLLGKCCVAHQHNGRGGTVGENVNPWKRGDVRRFESQ